MAFRHFRYHPDAETGLKALRGRGEETFEELKNRIRLVQREWEPQDDDHPQFVVPFYDFFLIFTASEEDPSVLVLAAVEQ